MEIPRAEGKGLREAWGAWTREGNAEVTTVRRGIWLHADVSTHNQICDKRAASLLAHRVRRVPRSCLHFAFVGLYVCI